MKLPDKYEIEVSRSLDGVLDLIDGQGRLVATVSAAWTQGQVESFLDGREMGLSQGHEEGRKALQHELRELLGVPARSP